MSSRTSPVSLSPSVGLVLLFLTSCASFSAMVTRTPALPVACASSSSSSGSLFFASGGGSSSIACRRRSAGLRLQEEGSSPAEEPAADAAPEDAAPPPAEAKEEEEDDLLSSPAFLKQKLKVLEKEMEEVAATTAQAQADAAAVSEEWTDKRSRLQMDFDNFRARHQNQTTEAQVEARIKLLQDFLPVLDNFDRARESIKTDGDADKEATNAKYQEMHASLMAVLTDDLSMEKIPTVGTEFDYNLHMALQTVPSAEYDEDVVSAEMQPGYTVNGQLVRAAYVMVSSGM